MEALWNKLPPDVRRESELTLGSFLKLARSNPTSVVDMLKLLQRNAAPMLSSAEQVAIVGPVNVGKSTLYNALVHNEQQKAEASPIPGTTRTAQVGQAGLFELVDTPGVDNAGEGGEKERRVAFKAAGGAEFLLVVFDAASSVSQSDRDLYREIKALGKPHLVVLNKIDLISAHQVKAVREAAARILDLSLEQVIPVSAQSSAGIDNLILEVTAAEPRLLLRVAEALPSLRRRLGWQAIRRSAVLSALIGVTPLPLADLVPLTLLQGNLVLTLAGIYGNKLTFKSVLELASTFGAGWVARTLFAELTKLAGVPGWVLAASVAASATVTIGFSALTWFETGTMPDKKQTRAQAKDLQAKLRTALSRLGRKRPSKERVTQELEDLLSDPFAPKSEGQAPAAPEPSASGSETSPPPGQPQAPPPDATN